MSAVASSERSPLSHRLRAPKPIFLAVVLLALALYTERAFALDWTTTAGRIGPGYFPRILGVSGLAVTALALVAAIASPRHTTAPTAADAEQDTGEQETGDADLGRHPTTLAIVVLAAAGLVLTLVSLGAIVAPALFLIATLAVINPGRWITNLAMALGLPVGLYLLFQTLLNAGLPSGILPAL